MTAGDHVAEQHPEAGRGRGCCACKLAETQERARPPEDRSLRSSSRRSRQTRGELPGKPRVEDAKGPQVISLRVAQHGRCTRYRERETVLEGRFAGSSVELFGQTAFCVCSWEGSLVCCNMGHVPRLPSLPSHLHLPSPQPRAWPVP